ncbi:PAS domain S-box protein [Halorubrum sp. AD140]|uniref:PAS domain S-box protein n=1 Tax=Halorubrum sp. AD140 TaxID=3050073 RepID=UPI002ACCF837|nr:PAS domain S-box protein [Halorubrum sp. AD140]MDZ5811890.1 PAS domain S-box protein [Halorubrum sp. AD140]
MPPEPSSDEPKEPTSGFFASFVRECSDPVVTIDGDGTIVYANPAVGTVLGYDPEDLRGRRLATLIAADATDERKRSLRRRLGDPAGIDEIGSVAFPVARADGRTEVFSVRFHRHAAPNRNSAVSDSNDDSHDADPVYTGVFRDGVEEVQTRDLDTFRNLVEHAGHAIYVTDTDGTIQYVNPAFTEHTGYGAAEAIGETPAILNSGEMPDEYFEALWTTLSSGEVWEEEIVDRKRDGSLYRAFQTIAPVMDNAGEITRFVAIQTDVTDRKAATARLRQYEHIVERLDDPIMLQRRDGTFELLNQAVCEFAGVDRQTLFGSNEFAFMDPEAAAEIDEHRREVLETESVVEYEISPTFPESGREATFSTRRYPYYDAEGDLAGTFAICRDVTDQKEHERALERYERAVNGATDLIAAVDRDGRYLFANPQYREYHGIDEGEVTDLTLADVVPADGYERVESQVEQALRGSTVEYRTRRTHPTRGTRTFDVRYYPLQNPDGAEPAGVVGVLRDVTDSENRARQLRVVDRILQHNLRNAMTVIRGRATYLTSQPRDGDTGGATADGDREDSVAAADAIVSRADDLLETSEKAHHITEILSDAPKTEPIDVGRIARQIVDAVAEEFPEATIDVATPADGTAIASATTWLSRAVAELVRNAVVHHDGDRPAVSVTVRGTADAVEIRVEDDGPRLNEMNRDVLVNGTAIDALYHGSGLGLWLVYWVVQQSGGSATVEDATPRGTVVTLTLPRSDR